MFRNTFLTRRGGLKAGVIVVPFLLAGACQDGSRSATPTDPAFSASSSSLPHINITELPLPVSVNAALTATDCSNSPGPNITLDGFAALGGFGVEMIFSNNLKSTHDYTVDKQVDIALQPAGQTITIPKQPVLGGAGGNPFMWVQFVNAAGRALATASTTPRSRPAPRSRSSGSRTARTARARSSAWTRVSRMRGWGWRSSSGTTTIRWGARTKRPAASR